MAKTGDTVRYLNAVGGGIIKRIEGQTAYVEEDGFETPVLLKEVVVVLPAGHEKKNAARLMFDQSAVDAVKARELREREKEKQTKEIPHAPEPAMPVEETAHGEKINLVLAFEPGDVKRLSDTSFAAVLVNDSNYFISFSFMTRGDGDRGWQTCYTGTVEPNMVVDLANFQHSGLKSLEQVAFQCFAFKKDKPFEMKQPVSVHRRLDLTKFYKLHCFRPGIYFDNPVLEIPLVRDDSPVHPVQIDPSAIRHAMSGIPAAESRQNQERKNNAGRNNKKGKNDPAGNPNRLLPLIEIDLHIDQLLDSTSGMDNAAIKQVQLDTVRDNMRRNARRLGQKIVFIHGKGDGVLREAVRTLLRREFPSAEWQDASFREYGFGATLVTIHANK